MATRKRSESAEPEQDRVWQRGRLEAGRFVLRFDQQSKASYATAELATAAGLAIKTRLPGVQVSVLNSELQTTPVVEPPDAG